MASVCRAPFDSVYMPRQCIQSYVTHEDAESLFLRISRLLESDCAAQGCFESKRCARCDIAVNELLKFTINRRPNTERNVLPGASVQLCRAVIGVEDIFGEIPECK